MLLFSPALTWLPSRHCLLFNTRTASRPHSPQAARQLLTLDTKDPKRLFEGPALLRRMARFGLLGDDERELDFVLQLTTEKMLERRLQTKVCLDALALGSVEPAPVVCFQDSCVLFGSLVILFHSLRCAPTNVWTIIKTQGR